MSGYRTAFPACVDFGSQVCSTKKMHRYHPPEVSAGLQVGRGGRTSKEYAAGTYVGMPTGLCSLGHECTRAAGTRFC